MSVAEKAINQAYANRRERKVVMERSRDEPGIWRRGSVASDFQYGAAVVPNWKALGAPLPEPRARLSALRISCRSVRRAAFRKRAAGHPRALSLFADQAGEP